MSSDRARAGIAYHSAEDILAHPKFPLARGRYIDAILALYEGDAFLTRLMGEAARGVIFLVILCLDAGYDPDDEATWLTLKRLKQQMAQYGLSSPRHIENTVALLIHDGFLESIPSQRDRRLRLLTPTAKMLSHDGDWLAANYLPLELMFPEPGYEAVMQRDPAFRRALRQVAMSFFAHGAQILGGNPDIMLFDEVTAGWRMILGGAHLRYGVAPDIARVISAGNAVPAPAPSRSATGRTLTM